MTCKACDSNRLSTFDGEVAIHFPGLEGLNEPIVWVFAKVVVCLGCGLAQFPVPKPELSVLARNSSLQKVPEPPREILVCARRVT